MSKSITVSTTDPICVALRTTDCIRKEDNRVKKLMELLGYSEQRAKRLDYFVHNMAGLMSIEAKAAAWVADEEFYYDDGVNDWPWAENGAYGWKGQGGGDWTVVEGKYVRVPQLVPQAVLEKVFAQEQQ
jgi:hypothetical protein